MNARVVFWIWKKELLEVRRDLRTVVLLVVLPAILYPLLMIVAAKVGAAGMETLNQQSLVVQTQGPLPVEVQEALATIKNIEVLAIGNASSEKGAPPRIDAVVRVAGPDLPTETQPIEIVFDGASERGQAAVNRLRRPLKMARIAARDQRLLDAGVTDEALLYGSVSTVDRATGARKGGFLLGRMLIPILIMILLLGAYYPAVDVTVGERERQTLRTLLCAPVDARAIAAGKLGAVATIAMAAASANLVGLLLTARVGILGLEGFQVPLQAIAVAFLLLLPMSIYMGALLMAAAALTQSQREAQTMLTPIVLVLILPVMGATLPGIEVTAWRAMIPVFGPALVMREALSGTANLLQVLSAFVGGAAVAVVALGIAARAFTVEALVTGRIARPVKTPGPLSSFDALLLVMTAAALFLVVGIPLQHWNLINGLVLTQILVFAGLPILWAMLRTTSPGQALGLTSRAAPGSWALVGGGLLLLPTLGTLVSIPATDLVSPEDLKSFEAIAEALLALPPLFIFLLVAVLPGVCEEITFRGAFLRGLSSRPVLAIVLSAAVFALFHGSLARLIPTFVLGVLLGSVALLSRSTFSSMILHVGHNGFAIALSWLLDLPVESDVSPYLSLPAGIHLLVLPGFALLIFGYRKARRDPSNRKPSSRNPVREQSVSESE